MQHWEDNALCATFPDVNFVPDPLLRQDGRPAKLVCTHCVVMTECLTAGQLELGVWGGMNELERLRIRRRQEASCTCGSMTYTTAFGAVCLGCGIVAS